MASSSGFIREIFGFNCALWNEPGRRVNARAEDLARSGALRPRGEDPAGEPGKRIREPSIHEKVAFLCRVESYPEVTARVETKETHMSWVFLTDHHAFKLKKPVRYEFLDYSTLDARRTTGVEEVRLNRRLAPGVYEGVVSLNLTVTGGLELNGRGEVVDWLVKMRRLPEERMLDQVIAKRAVTAENTRQLGELLAAFYRDAPVSVMSPVEYRGRLVEEIHANRRELSVPDYGLARESLEAITMWQLDYIEQRPQVFDARVTAGKVVEGHGDLRPEHICLEERPVIIDCLEFSRALRVLDAASDLTFLWLECERLEAPEVGRAIFEAYCRSAKDEPPAALIGFYKSWHACVRAKIAVWHLRDHGINHPAKWTAKAAHYLQLAAACGPFT